MYITPSLHGLHVLSVDILSQGIVCWLIQSDCLGAEPSAAPKQESEPARAAEAVQEAATTSHAGPQNEEKKADATSEGAALPEADKAAPAAAVAATKAEPAPPSRYVSCQASLVSCNSKFVAHHLC